MTTYKIYKYYTVKDRVEIELSSFDDDQIYIIKTVSVGGSETIQTMKNYVEVL